MGTRGSSRARWAALALLPCLACTTAMRRDRPEVDFGTVLAGTTVGPREARWRNAHETESAAVLGEEIREEPLAAFAVQDPIDRLTTVPPGGAHEVGYVFAPPAPGTYTGTAALVLLGDRGLQRSQGVRLVGRAVGKRTEGWSTRLDVAADSPGPVAPNQTYRYWYRDPSVAPLDPAAPPRKELLPWLEFGVRHVGQQPPVAHELVLRNTGHAPVRYELSWGSGEPSFAIAPPTQSPLLLPPNTGTRIRLHFVPRRVGRIVDALIVTPVDPDPASFQPPVATPWVGIHVAGTGVAGEEGHGEAEEH